MLYWNYWDVRIALRYGDWKIMTQEFNIPEFSPKFIIGSQFQESDYSIAAPNFYHRFLPACLNRIYQR